MHTEIIVLAITVLVIAIMGATFILVKAIKASRITSLTQHEQNEVSFVTGKSEQILDLSCETQQMEKISAKGEIVDFLIDFSEYRFHVVNGNILSMRKGGDTYEYISE